MLIDPHGRGHFRSIRAKNQIVCFCYGMFKLVLILAFLFFWKLLFNMAVSGSGEEWAVAAVDDL